MAFRCVSPTPGSGPVERLSPATLSISASMAEKFSMVLTIRRKNLRSGLLRQNTGWEKEKIYTLTSIMMLMDLL